MADSRLATFTQQYVREPVLQYCVLPMLPQFGPNLVGRVRHDVFGVLEFL